MIKLLHELEMVKLLPGAYSPNNNRYDLDNVKRLMRTYNLTLTVALEYVMCRRYEWWGAVHDSDLYRPLS